MLQGTEMSLFFPRWNGFWKTDWNDISLLLSKTFFNNKKKSYYFFFSGGGGIKGPIRYCLIGFIYLFHFTIKWSRSLFFKICIKQTSPFFLVITLLTIKIPFINLFYLFMQLFTSVVIYQIYWDACIILHITSNK